MKKYMLGFMLVSCLLSAIFMNPNLAKASIREDAMELITGNNMAYWISMDKKQERYTFTNDMIKIDNIKCLDLKGYSDISFYCTGDPQTTMHIQYNANDNVYYAYMFYTPSGSPVNSNGFYRVLK